MMHAHAHLDDARNLWSAWSWHPWAMLPLLVGAVVFVRGSMLLRARATRGWSIAHATCFVLGLVTLALAISSPLHELGEALLTAHMAQHLVLMTIAPLLLILGHPSAALAWGVPSSGRSALRALLRSPAVARAWEWATDPLGASLLHGVALVIWHVPRYFQSTLTSELAHGAQHASFVGTAVLLWYAVLRRRRIGGSILALFGTALLTGAIGAFLTLSPTLWYPAYAGSAPAFGMSALEDQQLAGLLMWIPGGLPYVGAALWLMLPSLLRSKQRPAPASVVTLAPESL